MPADDIGPYLRLVAAIGIFAVLWLLGLLLAREWVKSDLIGRGFRPVRVRWSPLSWWPVWGPTFRVVYEGCDRLDPSSTLRRLLLAPPRKMARTKIAQRTPG